MDERDKKRGGAGAGCLIMGVIVFFITVLYVIGIGPANWIAARYPGTEEPLKKLYWPIRALKSYIELRT